MTLSAPNRRPLRLSDFDYSSPGHAHFVTIGTHVADPPPFRDANLAREIVRAIDSLRKREGLSVFCFCLMPDHIHLLLSTSNQSGSLIDIIRDFKSYTTRRSWSHGWHGRLWKRSFYERAVRNRDEFIEVRKYILENPLKAGLVEDSNEYPYSGIEGSLPV